MALSLAVFALAGTPAQGGRPRPIGIVSDDFNTACAVPSSVWTYIDPAGDTTHEITGVGTQDAQLRIHLPAGSTHDFWTNEDRAPRLIQTIQNVGFEVETKIESALTARWQGQGIVVLGAGGAALRFEFYTDGTNVYAFAGSIANGVGATRGQIAIAPGVPMYMRVRRLVDTWTLFYGYDGHTWTTAFSFNHVIETTGVGLLATNDGTSAATAPAHTAIFDYFFWTGGPITNEDAVVAGDPGPKVLATSAIGDGTVNRIPDLPTYTCGQTVNLAAVPAEGHVFTGWSGDASGTQNPLTVAMTQDRTISAHFELDTTPPVLGGIHVSAGSGSAQITWTTNEPATSEVAYGTTLAYENGTVADLVLKTSHSILLEGLDPSTLYHFRITSVDGSGIPTSSSDLTFQTLPPGGGDPSGIISDDFQRHNLDRGLWEFVNPLGDAAVRILEVGAEGGKASIEVPGGVIHAVLPSGASAPRLRQAANDTDFTVDVGFTSPLTARFQEQGLLVEASATHYLRFDFYHDGTNLKLFAASYANGSVTTRLNATLPPMQPMYMRVTRLGNQWSLLHSPDGNVWTPATTFSHAMVVNAVSVWAGNEGTPAPAHVAEFDYFFNTLSPLIPEDGAVPADVEGPWIQRITTVAGQTTAQIRWVTDEPSSSQIEYGLTAAYELGSVSDPALVHDHLIVLEDLEPGTSYQFRVTSEDAGTNSSQQPGLGFATQSGGGSTGPLIDVWYGPVQYFGHIGLPQPIVNVFGKVTDPDGVASIKYRLNGGALRNLTIGPNNYRLAHPGDFNADISTSELFEGLNTVQFEARDTLGNVSTELVTVDFEGNNLWPLPYTVDWSSVSRIDDAAQVVDGLWTLEGDTLRPVELDYDRLVAIGDLAWTDYEVLVPITLWGYELEGFDSPSNRPALGGCLRWIGHQPNGKQPADGLVPIGACMIYRVRDPSGAPPNSIESWTNGSATSPAATFHIDLGITYWWKMRVVTNAVGPRYSVKVWADGQPEPAGWTVEEQLGAGELLSGSMLLLAHHTDASFGTVTVTPLP